MSPIPTCKILGTPLAVTDYAGAVVQAREWARAPVEPRMIAAANTHVTTLARRDPDFHEALAKFDLVLPDGMPLVWVMNRQLPTPLRDRVYGPTFMLHCLEATQGEGWTHMFVGGTEELLSALREKLLARFPALRIAALHSPPFGEWSSDDDARIIAAIEKSGAQFVWVGLGCPKQELWLARMKHRLPPAVYPAVGAAFAFHAGRVTQAPLWVQRLGMEWLFRLCAEPRRLWRRYLVFNSLFLFYLVKDAVSPPRRPAL
jgi:N-acetylglucosaminyldiphosphoundecaprenol N-acetyl-beta-D-mannosaminyltransferase